MTPDDSAADLELLAGVGRGDAGAFERLYRRHKDALFAVCAHVLGDRAAAEDVLHDVFVTLAQRAGELRVSGSVRAYLFRCCLNRARDRQRRVRRDPVAVGLIAEPADQPRANAETFEARRRLVALLDRLPPEQREVVCLRFLADLRLREIALVQRVSMRTVQSRYRYAVATLRRRLAAEGVPP